MKTEITGNIPVHAVAKKEFIGTVKSNKMNKSIVVDIVTPKPDKLYKKYVKSTKRVMAHDEANTARIGDTVRIVSCRPLSKQKRWRLAEIVRKATQNTLAGDTGQARLGADK